MSKVGGSSMKTVELSQAANTQQIISNRINFFMALFDNWLDVANIHKLCHVCKFLVAFLERNITHLSRCGFANPQGLSLSDTSDNSDTSQTGRTSRTCLTRPTCMILAEVRIVRRVRKVRIILSPARAQKNPED